MNDAAAKYLSGKTWMHFSVGAMIRGFAPAMAGGCAPAGAESGVPCPPIPGYTFIRKFTDPEGTCWCAYRNDEGGILFVECQ